MLCFHLQADLSRAKISRSAREAVEVYAMQFDVIVVGAGVEGSATAYQLIKNGAKRVLLLEQVLKLSF